MDFNYLAEVAVKAAKAAGSLILSYMNEELEIDHKEETKNIASQVVTKVDKEAEDLILSCLLPTCKEFDLGLLTEETEEDGSRFKKDYFWCIDPIDGTLNFINKEPGFSVSIALVAKDGTPFIGVIYDPMTNALYQAVKGFGVSKNGKTWKPENKNDYLTYVTDKKLEDTPRLPEMKELIHNTVKELNLIGFVELSGGASVMNGIRVLENGPACMIKFPKKEVGGGSIWDFASTACIFHELRLRATNFEGGKLDLNKKDSTFMHHEGVFYSSFKS